jgi:hypothetical protein
MFDTTHPAVILLPMLTVVALTFVAFLRMAVARAGSMDAVGPDFYRAHLGGQEPVAAIIAVRHYGNLMELPTLFYPACITAFVLGAVTHWTLVFAWAYVVFRVIQSAVHLTFNSPGYRGIAFILGLLCVFALWANVGLAIVART